MALTEESTFRILALCDYDPVHGGGPKIDEASIERPKAAFQLAVRQGQTFEVVGSDASWWLYVKGVSGQDEGYVPSACFAPIRTDLNYDKIKELSQGGTLLSSHINSDANLHYFPNAPNPKHPGTKRCPQETANFFSKVTFWWLNDLIRKGYKKPLEAQDLWLLGQSNQSYRIVPKLQEEWNKEEEKSKRSKKIRGPTDTEKAHLNLETEEISVIIPSESSRRNSYLPSLSKAVIGVFFPFFALGILFKIVGDILLFVQPQLLKLLIEHAEDKTSPEWKGYAYVVAMVITAIFQYLFSQHSIHVSFVTGMRVGTSLMGLVYSKALELSNHSRSTSTAGEILNLMSVDAQRIVQLCYSVNQVWSTPIQVCAAIYFLYVTMGASTLAGVAVLLLLVPLNILITRLSRQLQVKQFTQQDDRVNVISEVLSGIKVLKLYAWEESFIKKILDIRSKEVAYLMNSYYLTVVLFFFNLCAPMLVSMATFFVYTLTGNELTATKAFVAISLFNILRFPLSVFPRIIVNLIQAQISFCRLSDFLALEEKDVQNVTHDMPEHVNTQAAHIANGSFSWAKHGEPVLENINLNVMSGSLVAVVGQVGCGKSSLLSALLGETEKLDGMVYVKGTVAYVPQQAWIQNATFQENILFGRIFDNRRYKEVIRTCALQPDLKILSAGDLTEIGEKGINLSGGQKQRVNLARAVYFNADIYLLDDPLSAVDSHVGKHIFDKVIGPRGLLQGKTRILVTHSLQFLPQCDQIVVLQNGKISEVGTYSELLSNQGAFAEFINTYKNDNDGSTTQQDKQHKNLAQGNTTPKPVPSIIETPSPYFKDINLVTRKVTSCHHLSASQASKEDFSRAGSVRAKSEANLYTQPASQPCRFNSPIHSPRIGRRTKIIDEIMSCPGDLASDLCDVAEDDSSENGKYVETKVAGELQVEGDDHEEEDDGEEAKDTCKLTKSTVSSHEGRTTTVERSQTGRVKLSVIKAYSKALGVVLFFITIFALFCAEGFLVSSRIWLADWTSTNVTATETRDVYIGVYGGLGMGQAVCVLIGSLLLVFGTAKASRRLHNHLLQNVLHSPMAFFETTPIGRILNRFSRDMSMIDDGIPRSLMLFSRMFLSAIGTLFVICYATPVFLACILPLVAMYVLIQRAYIATSRQLRRLESVSRSPVYSQFYETITGTTVIRAYAQQKRFILDSFYKVDATQMANYPYICANRWLGLRLEFIGAVILLFSGIFAAVYRNSLPAGYVGLSVTFALQITGILTWLVRQSSELENNTVAVERVNEYTETPREAEWVIPDYRPPDEWPQEGRINVQGMGLRYRDGQPFVLHHLTFQIDSGEKVGVVGRTGAGKSTLSMALFRILECNMGKIVIDNIDISKIGLHDLRSRLTVIPQDPVLFSGSIRMNLNPFDEYQDEELWHVLEVVHLKSFISSLHDGLEHIVLEGGENLSVGQRQLVCLARALLRQNKILILDEATAAVDLETDELIQQTIRTEFADRTVLTIAHRLNTIMDYNRIMVLDQGSIVEFDTPSSLLARKGLFYQMTQDAGISWPS